VLRGGDKMALGTGWVEIERSFDIGSAEAAYWTGVRRYVGPKGTQALVSMTHLGTTTWVADTGTGTTTTMIPRRVRKLNNAREGGSVSNVDCSEIEVLYRSAYNPSTNPYNSATMTLSAQPVEFKDRKDINGKVIEGPHPTEEGMYFKVVKGSNLRIGVRSVITIRTAYAKATVNNHWDTYLDMVGKVNDAALPKLGMAIGELRLIAVEIPKVYLYNSAVDFVPVNFLFWYMPGGWDTSITVEKYYRGLKAVKVVDSIDLANNLTPTYIHKDTGAVGANAANAKLVIRTVDTLAKLAEAGEDMGGARKLWNDQGSFDELVALLWWPAP